MTGTALILLRVLGYLSLAWLVGGPTFHILSRPTTDPVLRAGRARGRRYLPWAALVYFLVTGAGLIAEAAAASDLPGKGLVAEFDWLKGFALNTWYGQVVLLKLLLVVPVIAGTLLLTRAQRPRTETASTALVLVLATTLAAVGPLAGHAAADTSAGRLLPFHILHALAVSAWIGGLPAWIALVLLVARLPTAERIDYTTAALHRFSRLAMACVFAVVLSGLVLGAHFIDTQGDLLGTSYGVLICAKVVVLLGILLIANRVRRYFLPALTTMTPRHYVAAAGWVSMEFGLAIIVLGLVAWLSQTIPAAHDQPHWWLPFRLAPDATWPVWPTPLYVTGGMLLAAACLLWLLIKSPSVTTPAIAVGGLAGAAAAAWSLSVPAFPDTYRRSTVPYLTVSIAEGQRQFERLCTGCHGRGGQGDGPAASGLPKPPANLSEPHTALHTAGDMYWWLGHGIEPGGMPAFADVLNDQDRWDVINFLRAFSQGFQARVLSPSVIFERPWLGAPGFYIDGDDDTIRELKDFRERSNVLLVFPDPGQQSSVTRLHELNSVRDRMRASGLAVLVISTTSDAGSPTAVRTGADEIRTCYELLSRTLSNRGDGKSLGMNRGHMEFLIDRFGYIRGRWIVDEESPGWSPTDQLLKQVDLLNEEPRILPPPDDHVH